jgi:thymidine phosphorylase
VEDAVDPGVGVVVLAGPGAEIRTGEPFVEVHYRDEARLPAALELLGRACSVGEAPPPARPQVLETVG